MVEEAPTADGRWRRWGRWGLLLAAALLLHLPLLRSTRRPLTPGERALAAIARQALLGGDQGLTTQIERRSRYTCYRQSPSRCLNCGS